MKVEVLVATMEQEDTRKYYDMNLKCDAIFANQHNRYDFKDELHLKNRVRMITTADRGVGKNRNQALMMSEAEICILADDDMIYENDYLETVEYAFNKLPMADIIIFNIDTIGKETRKRREICKIKRIHKFNCLNYGAARIAFRRESILKKNIWFSMLYGGGAKYSSGEDSLFLIEALKKGCKIYAYPKKIADVKQEESTWFNGYNDKLFLDKGVWIANAFPKLKYILIYYYSIKLSKLTQEFSRYQIIKLMLKGIQMFKK